MKNIITKQDNSFVKDIYDKEFYKLYKETIKIVSYDKQQLIKNKILSLKSDKYDLITEVAEAIQLQIKECEYYLSQAKTNKKKEIWVNAITSHFILLEQIVDYINNKPA